MKTKGIQLFSTDYLKKCKQMSVYERLKFLDDFRQLHTMTTPSKKSKLISIKVPEDLLSTFRQCAKLEGIPYQTKIKLLMKEWITNKVK